MQTRILTCGGTIEALDYETIEEHDASKGISIEELLLPVNMPCPIAIERVMNKDSRFINYEDRKQLAMRIKESKEDRILITHGTITMVDTAKFLGQLNLNKTIVLTGAMISGLEKHSDATFNLGYALSSLERLKAGVYLVMHARIFYWDNVRKNESQNRFEVLSKS